MKPLCCARLFWLFWLTATALFGMTPPKSAVVYYGDDLPYTLLGVHDYIIVQPDHVNTATHGFKVYTPNIYAYVSLGEAESGQSYFNRLESEWIVGENSAWKSKVLDLSNGDYHDFILEEVIEPLYVKGFRHFFFDTLDSYQLLEITPQQRQTMQEGLVTLIKRIHARYPDAKFVINRGFEVIETLAPMVDAVLFESLYRGLAPDASGYQKVSEKDRSWLLSQVEKIKTLGLDVIALDYLGPSQFDQAPEVAKQIWAHGVIPYIGDRELQAIGYSSKNALKREVLVLYDDTMFDHTESDDKIFSRAFLQLSMPLEYLGYIPRLQGISEIPLSDAAFSRLGGAVMWLEGNYAKEHQVKVQEWIERCFKHNVKLLFLETLEAEFHQDILKVLHIDTVETGYPNHISERVLAYDHNLMGFEIEPSEYMESFSYHPQEATPLLQVQREDHNSTRAAITPWGGYVLEGGVSVGLNKQNLWIVNPFEILQRALRLVPFPVPDPTTQNGRRLLFVHMDGDGIMNRAEWNPKRFAGEVLLDEIFQKYTIPLSISVIEAETASYGLFAKDSEALEAIAKAIFALPHVEPASHTFTHPFFWRNVENGHLDDRYHLAVSGYTFSIDREINGSLDYVNTRLATKEKQSRLIFWSGDCQPNEEVLAYMYQNDVLHINGGDTMVSNEQPWLSLIAPFGVPRGAYYQIFTAQQNENVYTNNWIGPFWGYQKAIQTFKLTDAPRRFKPINIYFHAYSGSKQASLGALKKVFDWAIKQETMPIYTSQFIPKVMDFYTLSIADTNDGWTISGADALKTVRLPTEVSVDIAHSEGIAGIKAHESGRYVHLSPQSNHFIARGEESGPYLVDANAPLSAMRFEPKRQHLELKGEVPLRLRYRLEKGCTLQSTPEPTRRRSVGDVIELEFEHAKEASVDVLCS
ncbi:MAG: endo alpha-1,4 polygalactosaminidase [Campylobacterales bacterium]|nr:endo alpha-1,4 polygalactosaminidase [Campylobacterales bacterium]